MTKENAKDFLPLVQAIAEGKTIQKIRDHYFWSDYNERIDGALENIPIENLRIKPKFFVFKKNDGTYYKSTDYDHNTKGANWQFEGDEEECDKWIEEHISVYVPFESVDELIECWNQKLNITIMAVGKSNCDNLTMPLIWVKGKGTQAKYLITEYWSVSVCLGDSLRNLKELYDYYTFLDGSPIGKIKE